MTTTTKMLLLLPALALGACGSELKLSPDLLVQLQLSPSTATLAAGLSQKVTAIGVYQDGHTREVSDQVAWTTLDGATAGVDASGLVTSAAPGSTRVTASLQGRSASADFTVTAATLASMELVPSLQGVPLGATVSAVALGRLTDGTAVDLTSQASWSNPDGGLVVLTPGVARARATGPARLCARLQGLQAFADLEVVPATAVRLQVSASRDALPRGARAALVVRATFTDGNELDVTEDATWTSTEVGVARVEGGQLLGLEAGTAFLTASYQWQSESLAVTVTPAELVALSLSPPEATTGEGSFVELTAWGTYTDDTIADVTGQVAWTSLFPEAVAVSNLAGQAGHALGIEAGHHSVVTAQVPGTTITATALVSVE